MLVILFILSQVSCDWVEISQNHYRKEPTYKRTAAVEVQYEDTTEDKINRQHSAVEKQLSKAIIDRVINVGNIRRVQNPRVKTPTVKVIPDKNVLDTFVSDRTYNNQHHKNPNRPHVSIRKPFYEKEVSETRNKPTNSEVRKPGIIQPVTRAQVRNNSDMRNNLKVSTQNPFNYRKTSTTEEKFYQTQGSEEKKINKDQVLDNLSEIIEDKDSNEKGEYYDDVYNFHNFQRISDTKRNKITSVNSIRNVPTLIDITPNSKTTETNVIIGKHNTNEFLKIEDYYKEVSLKNDSKFLNASVTTKPKFHNGGLNKKHIVNEDQFSEFGLATSSKPETSPRIEIKTNIPEISISNENNNDTKNNTDDNMFHNSEKISNTPKWNKMWKLMKVVADTIYKNSHRSFKSKIKYLENLKATLLTTIGEQIEIVWPDDIDRVSSTRRARSVQARGHLEFPSSESTLMTISFLTFAVFLIKLVLQLIHTYKNKTMMVTPAVVAAVGRAAAVIRSQHSHL